MKIDATTLRFLLVGGGCAFLFLVLVFLLARSGFSPFGSGAIAYVICVPISYTLQHGWTFSKATTHSYSLPRYLGVHVFTATFMGALAHVAVFYLGMADLAMSVFTTLIGGTMQYFASRYWVFQNDQ